MRPNQIKFANYRTSVVELKGGMNENVSSLELEAGELIDCKNYMMAEGGYGGYISTKGFEAFDGSILPSEYQSVVLVITDSPRGLLEGDIITGSTSGATAVSLETVDPNDGAMTVECLIDTGTFSDGEPLSIPAGSLGTLDVPRLISGGNQEFHLALEWAMSQIRPVPGEGDILGLNIFENKTYAFRKHIGTDTVGLYVADEATGWLEVDTSGNPITYSVDGHDFYFTNYNFYAGTDSFSMYWCDGVNKARVYDGSTVDVIDNVGMDPDDRPIRIAAHNYHLWLAYEGGSLQHSKVGDPLVWDGSLGAGEIGLGDEITNIEAGVQSSLVISLRHGIRVLTGNIQDDFVLEVFSENSGASPRTMQRLLGTIFFLDDRGLSTLEAVQDYGDYEANSISQRFKQTLLDQNHSVTATLTSRDLNQYRIFFDDRTAIYVSFEGKELKGATFMQFDRNVSVAAQGDKSRVDLSVFATDDGEGYVYRMDSGTSFNGTPIICRMTTAFYHYGSPRSWKTFKRATLEVSGDKGQTFNMKVDFEYNEEGSPRTLWYTPEIYSTLSNSSYGSDRWGEMVYGSATVANRAPVYIQGVGTNMSYKILSNEAYRPQHIIQNIITDYEVLSRRV